MSKKTFKIGVQGLHCKACEILVEEKMLEIPGIVAARVSHKKAELEIDYDNNLPDRDSIKQNLEKIGYSMKDEKLSNANHQEKKWKNLGIALLITLLLLLALKISGLANLTNTINPSTMSWAAIVIIGLIAGVSTCMALVGGMAIALGAKYARANPGANRLEKFLPHLYFNLGRILGFFLLGGVLGKIGSIFKLSFSLSAWITLLIGFIIIFLGLQILDIFPSLNKIGFSLPKKMAKASHLVKKNNNHHILAAFAAGPLSFFLPCGFTQSMQIYALSTGTFLNGAIVMSLFAIGTAPGLLSLGGLVSLLKNKKTGVFFKTAGLIIILFGIFNVSNAYKFLHLNAVSDSSITKELSTKSKDESQVIYMEQSNRGYVPKNLTVELNRPVKWIINSTNPYSCASSLIVPSLKINKQLTKGENIIEFRPVKVGIINFSCSMGMYRGSIEVINSKNTNPNETKIKKINTDDNIAVDSTCTLETCL